MSEKHFRNVQHTEALSDLARNLQLSQAVDSCSPQTDDNTLLLKALLASLTEHKEVELAPN